MIILYDNDTCMSVKNSIYYCNLIFNQRLSNRKRKKSTTHE